MDTVEYFAAVARECESRSLTAHPYHSGGGIYGVAVFDNEQATYEGFHRAFWGTADGQWGADIYDEEGEYAYSISTDVPGDCNPDTAAMTITIAMVLVPEVNAVPGTVVEMNIRRLIVDARYAMVPRR